MAPRTPLVNPTAYFERHDRPSLGIALGIMVGEALAVGVVLWLFVDRLLENVDASPAVISEVRSRVVGQVMILVLLTLVGWLILGAIFHALVWFADGNRGFGSTMAVVGEAEWTAFVLIPATGVVLLSVASEAPADPQAAVAFLQRQLGPGGPLLLAINIVGTVWRAVIAGIGLSITHHIPRSKAFAAAILVGVIGFLVGLAG